MSSRILFRCGRLFTMTPGQAPLDDAGILVDADSGLVLDVAPYRALSGSVVEERVDYSEHTVAPGLVNAHTHLELSHLVGKIPPGGDFTDWVKKLLGLPLYELDETLLTAAVKDCRESGAAFVADVGSRNPSLVAKACDAHGLGLLHFAEVLGFARDGQAPALWPEPFLQYDEQYLQARVALAGHALYSTHPTALQTAKAWDKAASKPYSIHLAEHKGEDELLRTGKGEFAELLLGRLLPRDFRAPGLSPAAYADALGLLDEDTLAVHCVHLDDTDIRILAERKVTVCLCPRSNARIGVGRAPWEALRSAGIRICLGTDSLASNSDLNMWSELRFFLENFPTYCTVAEALTWVTSIPASALGIDGSYGSLEPGKRFQYSIVPADLAARDETSLKPRAGMV
jgi:cytosine/adenosine deaminase-related metal-dependent hydrolase